MRRELENIILSFTREKQGIIHGAKALNERLPKKLYRKTKDFDIYLKKSGTRAKELSERLNIASRRNIYEAIKGKHKGTYRVVYKPTRTSVADITSPRGTIPSEASLDKLRFVKLSYMEKKAKRILKKIELSYRHKKDIATLKRIEYLKSAFKKLGWNK